MMNNKLIGLTIVGLVLVSLFTAIQQWSDEWTTPVMGYSQSVTFRTQSMASGVHNALPSVSKVEWEAEFINEIDTSFTLSNGGSLHLNLKQIWVRDSCFRDSITSRWYLYDDDTLYFRNFTHVKLHRNDTLIYNYKLGYELFNEFLPNEWMSLYRFGSLSPVIFNKKYGQIYINQILEIPYSDEIKNAYFALTETGIMRGKGISDACDGGISLSSNQDYLITCSEIISVSNYNAKNFDAHPVRYASMLNDSVYVVIYEPTHLKDEPANAYLQTVEGDTLFSFIYSDLSANMRQIMPVGRLSNGRITIFYDSSLGEVISFDAEDWNNPEYYIIDDLVHYEQLPLNHSAIKINETGLTFYLNYEFKITGFSTEEITL